MANEIAGFGGLNLFIFVISSDLIIRYIIRLGRFVRILEDQIENNRKGLFIFNFEQNRVVCSIKIFFSGQWDCWIWCFEFVFLIILSELTFQCIIAIYRQGSSTLLVHF
jgi:hypothetical protein